MAKPKHDYDSEDFYKRIEGLAMNGYTDEEIANELNLCREVFTCMKNGNYENWTDEENKRRGDRITNVLAHGRTRIVKFVQDKCECMGADKKCPYCGGTGWVTLTDKAVVQETEMELPPNMQAISTLLYHHDPTWRKMENKQTDEDALYSENGIDIDKWMTDNTNE